MSSEFPYDFILDFLPAEKLIFKKMFGHRCVYFDGLMVMFIISQSENPENGICIATSRENIESLGKELKSLKPLEAYGARATNWLIPADSDHFESDSEKACQLIAKRDPRIGRYPKRKKQKNSLKSNKR